MKKSNSTQPRKKTAAQKAAAKETRYHQAHPNAGMSFHPRSLYRGLTVPFRTEPEQKYLHPERHRTVREVTT